MSEDYANENNIEFEFWMISNCHREKPPIHIKNSSNIFKNLLMIFFVSEIVDIFQPTMSEWEFNIQEISNTF